MHSFVCTFRLDFLELSQNSFLLYFIIDISVLLSFNLSLGYFSPPALSAQRYLFQQLHPSDRFVVPLLPHKHRNILPKYVLGVIVSDQSLII